MKTILDMLTMYREIQALTVSATTGTRVLLVKVIQHLVSLSASRVKREIWRGRRQPSTFGEDLAFNTAGHLKDHSSRIDNDIDYTGDVVSETLC